VEALANGLGRDVVERAPFQFTGRSSLSQRGQRIDELPQYRASGLPTSAFVRPRSPRIWPRMRCNGGHQAASEPKQTPPG